MFSINVGVMLVSTRVLTPFLNKQKACYLYYNTGKFLMMNPLQYK